MQNNSFSLPEDFSSRPATMKDADIAVDLINDFSHYHAGVKPATVHNLSNEWQSPGYNLAEDVSLVFNQAGSLVGYADCWDVIDPPVQPWASLFVHPEFEGRGIGKYLLAWLEKRAQKAVSRVKNELRVSLHTSFFSAAKSMKALVEQQDYQLIRHAFRMQIDMDAPPPPPVWPKGIDLKPFDPQKDLEMVYTGDDQAFRDHFGYVEPADHQSAMEDFAHYMTGKDSYDPSLWFLAMDGEQLAGFSVCNRWARDDRECGYVSSLGVLRPWRRRGLGLALLRHSFREFYQRGYRKVALGVDAGNLTGALRLYKKAGMYVKRQYDHYEKVLQPGRQISVQSLG